MIDHDKLRQAQLLADELSQTEDVYHVRIVVDFTYYAAISNSIQYSLEIHKDKNGDVNSSRLTLDQVIFLLRNELSSEDDLNPIFSIGDTVYFCKWDEVLGGEVSAITTSLDGTEYSLRHGNGFYFELDQPKVFATKSEAIKSRIEHWKSMK